MQWLFGLATRNELEARPASRCLLKVRTVGKRPGASIVRVISKTSRQQFRALQSVVEPKVQLSRDDKQTPRRELFAE